MGEAHDVYDPKLHPRNWAGLPGDHPWLVEERRAADRARRDDDVLDRLDVAWVLAARMARAAAEQLGLPVDIDAPPARWVDLALRHVDDRVDRFPGAAHSMPPRAELEVLAEVLAVVDAVRGAGDPRAALAQSSLGAEWRLETKVANAAYQLVAAMTPPRPPDLEMSGSDAFRITEHAIESLALDDPNGYMSGVVDLCAELLDGPWEAFREIDYSGDVRALAGRVVEVAETEPPPAPLKGLLFVASNPYDDGYVTADLSFSGATSVDAGREASFESTDYGPRDGRLHSGALARIYDVAYRETNLGNAAEEPLGLAHSFLLGRACTEAYAARAEAAVRCAAGSASGDVYDLGPFGGA